MSELRPLSTRQVLTCESSESTRCRCRCNGQRHGSGRSALPEFFERLPKTDPHRIPERSRQLPLPHPLGGMA